MKILRFEDVFAWQKAEVMSLFIYQKLRNIHDFSFKDQLQRAAISIMNNIAEGFERQSNRELKRFLYIAKGSCGEVRSMLLIASQLGYLSPADFKKCYDLSCEISKLLAGFIKSI